MERNTSISLGTYFVDFIKKSISAGRYKNASEVVRAGLRLLEEEEIKCTALREAMQDGLGSGLAKDFEPDVNLKLIREQNRCNG